jgi:hypothetical protein
MGNPGGSKGDVCSVATGKYQTGGNGLPERNIDKLYSNAIEPWKFELSPNRDNTGLKARRYLYAPMEFEKKITIVKITVKEYADTDLQNKLYSIEAVGLELRA